MDRTLPERIAASIAEVEGVEPDALGVSIQDHVSTDAIRDLKDHDSDSWRLQFETPNHLVEVTGSDVILVDGERIRPFS
ncbi:HalOD1 output domain-containing protein [Halorubrum cibi]|uniref:Halobacterial output domain-containing protein n=1 Tax=Halorubrum cibi TaxID=413815 RepID=A0A521C2W6_9EURY|nr:HalOD1 output domain-containing protein [Halorubrum cibi]SMO53733.1 hypothetical protein SAMN06264867_103260 [Halorubrum cibi]